MKIKNILLLVLAISLLASCSQQKLTTSKIDSVPYNKYSKSVEWVAENIEEIDTFKNLESTNKINKEELLVNNQKNDVNKSTESILAFQNNSIKEKIDNDANTLGAKSILTSKSPIISLKSNLKNVKKNKELDKYLKAAIIFALLALIFSALGRIELLAIFAVVFWVLALIMLILWVLNL